MCYKGTAGLYPTDETQRKYKGERWCLATGSPWTFPNLLCAGSHFICQTSQCEKSRPDATERQQLGVTTPPGPASVLI